MAGTDQSTHCLITNTDQQTYITRHQRKNIFSLKIALWTTIFLSMLLAVTALIILVYSNFLLGSSDFTYNEYDYDDFQTDSTSSEFAEQRNSLRLVATHHAAKVIVTRADEPFMELDLQFNNNINNFESRRRRNVFYDDAPEPCESSSGTLECVSWPHGARLTVDKLHVDPRAKCYNITLVSAYEDTNSVLSACLPLNGKQLYGGPTVEEQRWPSHTSKPLQNVTYLPGYDGINGVAERFWVTSNGEALYIPPDIPLFLTMNSTQLCVESRLSEPYHRSNAKRVTLSAVLCGAKTSRDVFLASSRVLLGTPSSPPDSRMLKYPIWSTWARYKKDINAEKVIKFANDIKHYGFPNSQLEIDDRWEVCYGFSDFDNTTFPEANKTVSTLHKLGFRVTLWMHPFENNNCYSFLVANGLNLLVIRPEDNATDSVKWWDGKGGLIDFTKPLASQWFRQRLEFLTKRYNIDGFKFDAGEASYVPSMAMLYGPEDLQPASLSTAYASTAAEANPGMAEMRSVFMAQRFPLVIRMDDKSSVWGYKNGLKSLIPSLLTLNIMGYSTIMPDMIGGNGYGTPPDKELFIRWLQASTFMPVLQFSYAPWDFDDETVVIAKKYVNLHSKYSKLITKLAQRKMKDSSPINAPIWWIAPNDKVAQTIDSEYLLGDRLLVAPVLEQGATSRDIYLPAGTWREGLRPKSRYFNGPIWIRNHSAPLHHLPYFERINTETIDVSRVLLA